MFSKKFSIIIIISLAITGSIVYVPIKSRVHDNKEQGTKFINKPQEKNIASTNGNKLVGYVSTSRVLMNDSFTVYYAVVDSYGTVVPDIIIFENNRYQQKQLISGTTIKEYSVTTNSLYDADGWNTYYLRYNDQVIQFNIYIYTDPNTYSTTQGASSFAVTGVDNSGPSPNTDDIVNTSLYLDYFSTQVQDYIDVTLNYNGKNYVLGQKIIGAGIGANIYTYNDIRFKIPIFLQVGLTYTITVKYSGNTYVGEMSDSFTITISDYTTIIKEVSVSTEIDRSGYLQPSTDNDLLIKTNGILPSEYKVELTINNTYTYIENITAYTFFTSIYIPYYFALGNITVNVQIYIGAGTNPEYSKIFNVTLTEKVIVELRTNDGNYYIDQNNTIEFFTYDELDHIPIKSILQIKKGGLIILNLTTDSNGYLQENINFTQVMISNNIKLSNQLNLTIEIIPLTPPNEYYKGSLKEWNLIFKQYYDFSITHQDSVIKNTNLVMTIQVDILGVLKLKQNNSQVLQILSISQKGNQQKTIDTKIFGKGRNDLFWEFIPTDNNYPSKTVITLLKVYINTEIKSVNFNRTQVQPNEPVLLHGFVYQENSTDLGEYIELELYQNNILINKTKTRQNGEFFFNLRAPESLGIVNYQVKYAGNQSNYLLSSASDFVQLDVQYSIYIKDLVVDQNKVNLTKNDLVFVEIGGIIGNSYELSYKKGEEPGVSILQFVLQAKRENKTFQIPDTFGLIQLILQDLNTSEQYIYSITIYQKPDVVYKYDPELVYANTNYTFMINISNYIGEIRISLNDQLVDIQRPITKEKNVVLIQLHHTQIGKKSLSIIFLDQYSLASKYIIEFIVYQDVLVNTIQQEKVVDEGKETEIRLQVTDQLQRPLSNIHVQIIRPTLTEEISLAEGLTDVDGYINLSYEVFVNNSIKIVKDNTNFVSKTYIPLNNTVKRAIKLVDSLKTIYYRPESELIILVRLEYNYTPSLEVRENLTITVHTGVKTLSFNYGNDSIVKLGKMGAGEHNLTVKISGDFVQTSEYVIVLKQEQDELSQLLQGKGLILGIGAGVLVVIALLKVKVSKVGQRRGGNS